MRDSPDSCYTHLMWKRDKSEPRPLVDWDKIERLAKWNDKWDPPGELSTFYSWDDTDLKWVEKSEMQLRSKTWDEGVYKPSRQTAVTKARDSSKPVSKLKAYHETRGDFMYPPGARIPRVESAVMEVRKGKDMTDLDKLKEKFGWHTEVDMHLGQREFVWINGTKMLVSSAQATLNNHFGTMYLGVDGKFGPQTANLLHKLDTTHRN